jgi:hypothetical protein
MQSVEELAASTFDELAASILDELAAPSPS